MKALSKMFYIAWIAVRELLYERVFYVLLSFAVLAIFVSLMLGQMTYADQQKLTLDFMLAGAELSMVLFSVFIGISLFKRELMLGSVAMVLSKPISRTTFFLGKFFGQVFVQFVVCACMIGVTALVCSGYPKLSTLALFQSGWLIYLELCIITAITYLFAINAGATTTAIAALVAFGLGHLRDAISMNIQPSSPAFTVWQGARHLIPDLEIFNMKTLAAQGISLGVAEMSWATAYAVVCLFFFLFLAGVTFQRKDILT